MTHQIVSCNGMCLDSAGLRQALGRFATGVAVVATCTPEADLSSASPPTPLPPFRSKPPLVPWSLQPQGVVLSGFARSGFFTVSILGAEQEALARHSATRRDDKFASVAFTRVDTAAVR